MKVLIVAATAVPLTGLGLVPSPRAEASQEFPPPTNVLRLFAQTNGGGDSQQVYSEAQAVELAQRFDVIVGLRWTFDVHVDAMRTANPNLRLIVYMNGAMSRRGDQAGMPESWFLHDASGKRVRNLHFDLNFMDTGNPGWQNWAAGRCSEWIRLSGFDGCFLDDMGAGNLGTNLSAWPIDPRTGQKVTEANWISYARSELAVVQKANPGRIITSNGLNNGSNYFGLTGSARLLDTAYASSAEGWLRGSADPVDKFRRVDDWKKDIDMLVDAGNRGRSVLAGTKLWTNASSAQQSQWRSYTYASFLLGTNGNQVLNFNARGPGRPDAATPLEKISVGTPLEPYSFRGGVFQRRFSTGLAIVNPGSTTVSVEFGAPYRLVSGEVRTSVTMQPHTGQVLTTATTQPPVTTAPTTTLPPTTTTPTPTQPPSTTSPATTTPTTSPATGDAPPDGIAVEPTAGEQLTTNLPTFSGFATDDRGVARVNISIRDMSTKKYLRSDGTWQTRFSQIPTALSAIGNVRTNWSVTLPAQLPNGSYRFEVRAFDTASQLDPDRPMPLFHVEA